MRGNLGPLLRYEFHIARVIARLFGPLKAVLFLVSLPSIVVTKRNRTAYELLGKCSLRIAGHEVTMTHPDVRFIDEIVERRCYTPSSTYEVGPGEIIVDAGANVGIFSIYAALSAVGGTVVAVEPSTENAKYLRDNLRANGLRNVVVIEAALADKTGRSFLYSTNPGTGSIVKPDVRHGSSRGQVCDSITVPSLLASLGITRVDLMKVDIEGAEFLIFRNSNWLRGVRRLVLEVHLSMGRLDAITVPLLSHGFRVTTIPSYDKRAVYVYASRSMEIFRPASDTTKCE